MTLSFDKNDILKNINSSNSFQELEKIRIEYLGKKGLISREMKLLGDLSVDEKKIKGQELNFLKQTIENTIKEQKSILENNEIIKRIQNENLVHYVHARKSLINGYSQH